MAKIRKETLASIDAFLKDDICKEKLGENYENVVTIVKAALSLNDTGIIFKIVGTLIAAFSIHDLNNLVKILNDPDTIRMCLDNSLNQE